MNKYLIIYRCDDAPVCKVISKESFEEKLNSKMFDGWTFLTEIPFNLNDFPSKSVFVFYGNQINI